MFKMRHRLIGIHVEVNVFAGKAEGALALAGTLRFRVDEWNRFRNILSAGRDVLLVDDGQQWDPITVEPV